MFPLGQSAGFGVALSPRCPVSGPRSTSSPALSGTSKGSHLVEVPDQRQLVLPVATTIFAGEKS